MFAAVRTRLAHAWHDLHARGLPSLFVFELVVVTLGVLLAQAIANLAQDRADQRRMEAARERALDDVAAAAGSSRIWQVAVPCLEARVGEIMRAATSGEAIDPARLVRPSFSTFSSELPEGEDLARYAKTYGRDRVDLLREVQRGAEVVSNRARVIARDWQDLGLLDPAYGKVDEADRRAGREAANRILGELRGIEIGTRYLLLAADDLGIRPRTYATERPVEDCDDLWSRGAIFVRPDDEGAR